MKTSKVLYALLIVIVLVTAAVTYHKYQTKQGQLHFAKAEALFNYQKYQEAAQEYEFVATSYPRAEYAATCWYKAGLINRRFLLNDAAALKDLQKFVALFPQNQYRKEGLILLVDVCGRLGQYKEQTEVINRLLTEFPGAVDADTLRLEIVKGFYKQGQLKEALEEIALIKNKDSDLVRNCQEYYQLLISQNPYDSQSHLELSRIYKGMGLQAKAAAEFDSAKWIKKNEEAVKAAQQLKAVPAQYPRGIIGKTIPPKIKLSPREENLYIEYDLAQHKYWPAAMNKKSQSLGVPKNDQEAMALGKNIQQYEKEWWSEWYANNKTSNNECEKISDKVLNDQGLTRLLNEKIAKLKN